MSTEKNNIHLLKENKEAEKDEEVAATEEIKSEEAQSPAAGREAANRDMGKVAVIVSLLSVVLLVIFFFGLNQNIAGLSAEVKSLGELRGQVQTLDERLINLEDVNGQMTRTVVYGLTNEMAMEAKYLEGQINDADQRAQLKEIQAMLEKFRQSVLSKKIQ